MSSRAAAWWIVGAAIAVVVVLGVVSVLLFGSRLNPTGSAASTPTPSPTVSAGTSPSPSATAFECTSTASTMTPPEPASPISYVSDIRAASHDGYDRLTIEFKNGEPSGVEIRTQSGTTFTQGASGQSIKLAGQNGILVILHGADGHTAYTGSRDLKTSYAGLAETRIVEDFEGVAQLALGVNGPACYHVSTLDNPARIVVDVQAA